MRLSLATLRALAHREPNREKGEKKEKEEKKERKIRRRHRRRKGRKTKQSDINIPDQLHNEYLSIPFSSPSLSSHPRHPSPFGLRVSHSRFIKTLIKPPRNFNQHNYILFRVLVHCLFARMSSGAREGGWPEGSIAWLRCCCCRQFCVWVILPLSFIQCCYHYHRHYHRQHH